MLRNPTAHLIGNTMAIASIVFACGFACGYGLGALAGFAPELGGLSVGGFMATLGATIYVAYALDDSREYWKYRQTLGKVELPKPAPDARMHRIALDVDADNLEVYYLPTSTQKLSLLFDGLAVNRSLSGRLWYGPNKPFTQKEFMKLRREMVRRGLAEAIGNSYGVTDKGLRAFDEGEVLPHYTIDGIPESYPTQKRFRQINRGKRGEGLGARK